MSKVVKNRENVDVGDQFCTIFWPSQISGSGYCTNCTHFITPASCMEKFSENTFTIQEVMNSITLNFKANFKFSLFFWGGGPSPFGCVLVSLCQFLPCVKISGRSTL